MKLEQLLSILMLQFIRRKHKSKFPMDTNSEDFAAYNKELQDSLHLIKKKVNGLKNPDSLYEVLTKFKMKIVNINYQTQKIKFALTL